MRYEIKLKLSKTTDCVSNSIIFVSMHDINIMHINNHYSLHRLI